DHPASADMTKENGEKAMTTFVLIHGSYQGGWIWQRAASRLRAAGHTVYAPSLDGCAERKHQVRAGITTETHAAEIAEMLFYEDLRDVVMVGTSSGGMVLCRAADQLKAKWFELDTGHYPMLSTPDELTALVTQ